MYSLAELQNIISKELGKVQFPLSPSELYDPIYYVLGDGGKRIRPSLLLLSFNIFSQDITKAISPAIGIEIFHNFTLLHDDIMDKADLRRNRPTVHKKWNENTAILSGDAMFILSYEYFFNVEKSKLLPVLKLYNKTALEVCEGQQFDMNFETRMNVSEAEYINMIRLKTAVLIAASLKIGAIIGGATKHQAEHLYNFGINLGIAFQLQDDLLDSFGTEETFGKKIGGDIAENKKTFLLIKSLNSSNKSLKTKLINLLSEKQISPTEKIRKVLDIYNKLNVRETTENEIEKYFNLAVECLVKSKIQKEKLTELYKISNQIKLRNR